MADITAQQIADAIGLAVSEQMEPDEQVRITVREDFSRFVVRGEFDLELVSAALNDMWEHSK